MPRYLKQTDRYSCGVIAAMNLDRWQGKKALHGHIYFIDKLSKDGNSVRCVNLYSGFPPLWIHWRWMCKLLTRSSVWRIPCN